MDKLTAIRIKYPNGSYSSPIYISVEAANVRYNDVQNIVDVVDSLSARVSAIASLPEGSTTGDAQLMDARTGFDGITYNSAGDAIRANDEKNTQLVLVRDTQPTETWNKLWLDTSDADEQKIISTDDMANIVAAYYDEEADYAVGDYVIHEDATTGVGKLYKCITAISGGEAWTAAHWNETIITEDYSNQINDLKSAITYENDYVPVTPTSVTDNYRVASDGSLVSADGYYALDYDVKSGDKLTFFRSLIGYNSTFAIYLMEDDTVKSSISDSGITGQSGKYNLTVPSGVNRIKATGSLANKYPYNLFKQRSSTSGNGYKNGTQITYVVGEGNMPTIQCACDFADANDIIYIKSGTYNEAVSIWNKKLHLIGEDKNTTFIVEHVGNYDNPPLEMNVGSLSNLTIIEDGSDSESDTATTGKLGAYCLHIEAINQSTEVFEVSNCVFKNAVHTPLGCGLQNNYTVRFRNCVFECTATNEGSAKERGAFFVHTAVTTNPANQHVIAENCAIYSADNIAVLLGIPSGATGTADYRFTNCVIWSAKRGIADSVIYYDNNSENCTFSNNHSYGNTVQCLNVFDYSATNANSIEKVNKNINIIAKNLCDYSILPATNYTITTEARYGTNGTIITMSGTAYEAVSVPVKGGLSYLVTGFINYNSTFNLMFVTESGSIINVTTYDGGSVTDYVVTIPSNAIEMRFTSNANISLTIQEPVIAYPAQCEEQSLLDKKIASVKNTVHFVSRQGNFYIDGTQTNTPYNNLVGIENAKNYGYDFVRVSVRFTSDCVPVLSHNASINSIARNPDGTQISSTINVADHTLSELNEYDYGIQYGSAYTGMKITELEDALTLCKKLGMFCIIEVWVTEITNDEIDALFDAIVKTGSLKTSSVRNHITSVVEAIATRYPGLNFGVTCQAGLSEANQLLKIDLAKTIKNSSNVVTIVFGYLEDGSTTLYDSVINTAVANGFETEIASVYTDVNMISYAISKINYVEVGYVKYPYEKLLASFD